MTSLRHSGKVWRLMVDSPSGGAWNMAVDEAILEAVGCSEVPPTLRLYAWEPPCLSLGYAQPISDVDMTRLRSLSWDIVRRPTGGKAILHTDELTYSIMGTYEEKMFKGSLLESYRSISQGLLAALEGIGIQPSIKADDGSDLPPSSKHPEAICFEVPSKYEITVNQKKLLGSAQARRKEGILQHGTLPLYGDISRITQVLVYASEAERNAAAHRVHMRATTVAEVLNHPITWEIAAQAFVASFEKHLGLKLIQSDLTTAEKQHAEELVKIKYANQQWTYK